MRSLRNRDSLNPKVLILSTKTKELIKSEIVRLYRSENRLILAARALSNDKVKEAVDIMHGSSDNLADNETRDAVLTLIDRMCI